MSHRVDKVIVTNWSVIRTKYRSQASRVADAIAGLIDADKARGLRTICVALDQRRSMERFKTRPVTRPRNERQNKQAIDGIAAALEPDYLMILGADDVVPSQRLANPLHDPAGDPDPFVPSDLPYACNVREGLSIGAYIAPNRVVGRLPDPNGASDPEPLIRVLDHAARHQAQQRDDVRAHFCVSADAWKASTAQSLQSLFGDTDALLLSPPDGRDGNWPDAMLARRLHFINCHGAPADPRFYGQLGASFPVAHASPQLVGKIAAGTVVASECCYGSELYDPELAGGVPSICETYLHEGAAAYFGSSTVAYGPPDSNDAADLICQFFLKHVLCGASTGRASLQARLEFASLRAPLDPYNAKTLAQFSLLGDPSLHIVQIPRSTRGLESHLPVRDEPASASRAQRRLRLTRAARALQWVCRAAEPAKTNPPPRIKRALIEAASLEGARPPRLRAFHTIPLESPGAPHAPATLATKLAQTETARFFSATTLLESRHGPGFVRLKVVVATEVGGRFVFHQLDSK